MPNLTLFYSAQRETELTETEQLQIREVEQKYSVEEKIEKDQASGKRSNWESFCIYSKDENTDPKTIFGGATRLPDSSAEEAWVGLQHWCSALTEIRRILVDADWNVRIDDRDIYWDESHQEFDPSV